MKVVALAGGTGSAKLLRGLASQKCDLTVVANVGDNYWIHGLYVCPDVDIAMYTLAGIADSAQGWGIKGDTFGVLEQLGKLGQETWFRLGDRDFATSIIRTMMLREGRSLTQATRSLGRLLKVKTKVLPATDSAVETYILTNQGTMHLQEYWVMKGGRPAVRGVKYVGASRAKPTPEVLEAIESADRIIVSPANPITSIGPILAVRSMRRLLRRSRARKVALSPMVGRAPFSGPAGRMMKGLGVRADSVGVAELYSGFLESIIIDKADWRLGVSILDLGVRRVLSDISMESPADERRLAKELLGT